MNSEQLNLLLINKFPALYEKYLDEVSWQEGDSTGSHTVYGDVLTPYLIQCIIDNDTTEIKKIFDFLEEVIMLNDEYCEEVIACSVIESISYLFDEREYLSLFLGNKSKQILNEITTT